jgi:hypothetical protein
MPNKVINIQQAFGKKGTFIELTGKRAADVSKNWKVEILKFKDRTSDEINYAVRLTSTLDGQTVTFLKEDIEDNAQSKNIERRLRKIGRINTNEIKAIARSVNDGLYEQQDKIIFIEDISSLLLNNRLSGVAPETYYKKFVRHYKNNLHLFPKRSSNMYSHDVSEGVILDNLKKYRIGENGHYPVAIRTGALKELFEIDSDNKYSEILDSLLKMGVLQGKLRFKDFEEKEDGEVILIVMEELRLTLKLQIKRLNV